MDFNHLTDLANAYNAAYGDQTDPLFPDFKDLPIKSGIINQTMSKNLQKPPNAIMGDYLTSVERINHSNYNPLGVTSKNIVLKKDMKKKKYNDVTVPVTIILGALLLPFAI